MLAMLVKFSVFFGLKVSYLVFGATDQVSHALQANNTMLSALLRWLKHLFKGKGQMMLLTGFMILL